MEIPSLKATPYQRPPLNRDVVEAAKNLVVLDLAGRLPAEPGFETLRMTALGALMRGLAPG